MDKRLMLWLTKVLGECCRVQFKQRCLMQQRNLSDKFNKNEKQI